MIMTWLFFTYYAVLLLLITIIDANSVPCDNDGKTSSTASSLAAAISQAASDPNKHSWHVHTIIPAQISGLPNDTRVSFDAPSIIMDPIPNDDDNNDSKEVSLTAVFHAGAGAQMLFATYAAHTTTTLGEVPNPQDGWTVTSKLSDSGSMGHLFPMLDGSIYFAYEIHTNDGNTVGIRLYQNIETLRSGGAWRREVQLQRTIALPQLDNTVTTEKKAVRNIGTPTITQVVQEDYGTVIHIRFHYYPIGGSLDLPGVGSIVFPPSGEDSTVVSNYDIWYGRFENKVNNALRIPEAMGKIGQRAEISNEFLLYEAQMANAGEGFMGWLSWRPVLYPLGCENPIGSILPLTLPTSLQTMANPHVTHMEDFLLLSFFVPSEPFDSTKTSQYESFDPEKCPTCASNPMDMAELPARSGTFLVIVRTSCAMGEDDPAFQFQMGNKKRDCRWLANKKKKKRNVICEKTKKCNGKNQAIADCCPVACDAC